MAGGWHTFWRAERAPVRWSAPDPAVSRAVRWQHVRAGLERARLDCRRAVLLDGGLSGQLAIRGADGRVSAWPGLRDVPLALIAR